ncbi:MAG TPA: pantoate--beta-alanine ligase [Candidatus Tidjanibacter faecipullorum]|uniref:Pantothenate synthetase n=1 Tax=Candidatus Tidjanibacter faecipullorum TaxID=2838766 RepID=A0A9D2DE44_9BACT|nr:pantoate--beta-alanine ligase [Candidatus Tidjanibacter faecipullorum]
MEKFTTVEGLKGALAARKGSSVGLVPTMGALHDGHVSLVRRARAENDTVVVSVFVNPTQFNDKNDLRNYPRTPEADLEVLRKAGADIVFMPTVEEVYPEPDTRVFDFGQLDKVMEGATRPGHFNGVGQVVSRLLELVKPDRAYFGEKDFQQIAVIKELVRQLAIPVQIVECPIVREADGLALSSRNLLLTAEHRAAAPMIHAAMQAEAETAGTKSVEETERDVIARVEKSPLLKVIYFQLVDEDTLQPVKDWKSAAHVRGCIAVQAGEIRLIDNLRFL